jgi:hypothetical protein
MVYLPRGDVSEAPTSERSFLAGETEAEFRFRNHQLGHLDVIHHGIGDASGNVKHEVENAYFIYV